MTNELDLEKMRALVNDGNVLDKSTVLRLLYLAESEAEYAELNPKLAAILLATANALKGEPKPMHSHSWHDLAEVAGELKTRLERAERANARVRDQRDKWEQEGSAYWISAEAAVIALDHALRALDGEQE
ncbi:hypothetical protein [Glutamicibacter arilaitensis]|uniref:hypothetical protein n=1 Tax=Glutamicibacter arilaitensis TaxID=256701 RepID=UPI00384C49AE